MTPTNPPEWVLHTKQLTDNSKEVPPFMMTTKDLMCRELYTLKPSDNVHQARQLMLDKRIRHVPIIDDGGEFMGLLTKRDILAASVSILADIDPAERDELEASIPISKVMITDIIAAEEDTPLYEAAKFMLEQKHGCLPVLQGSKLVGILTEADFVRFAIYLMDLMENLGHPNALKE